MNMQLGKGQALGSLWRTYVHLDLPSTQLEFPHKILALLFHLAGTSVAL